MNSNQDDESANSTSSNKNTKLDERLLKLDDSLKKHHGLRDEEAKISGLNDKAGMAYGLKLGSEFASAILVGAFIGWALDTWLQTTPFGLIVFLILGFAAGVLNVMRAAGQVPESGAGQIKGRSTTDDGEKM